MASLPINTSTVIDSDTRIVEGGGSANSQKGGRVKSQATLKTQAALPQPSTENDDAFFNLSAHLQCDEPQENNNADDDEGSDFNPANASKSNDSDEESASDMEDTPRNKKRKNAAGSRVAGSKRMERAKATAASVIVANLPKETLALDMSNSMIKERFVSFTLKIENREQFCRLLSIIDRDEHALHTRSFAWGEIFNRRSFGRFIQSAKIIYIILDGDFLAALKSKKNWNVESFDSVLMKNNSTVWYESGLDLFSFFDFFVKYVHDSSSKQGCVVKGLLEKFEQDKSKTQVIVDRFNRMFSQTRCNLTRQSVMSSLLDGPDADDEWVEQQYCFTESRRVSEDGSPITRVRNHPGSRGRPRGSRNGISGGAAMTFMQSLLTSSAGASTGVVSERPSSLQIISMARPTLSEDDQAMCADLGLFDPDVSPALIQSAIVEQIDENEANDGAGDEFLNSSEQADNTDNAGLAAASEQNAVEERESVDTRQLHLPVEDLSSVMMPLYRSLGQNLSQNIVRSVEEHISKELQSLPTEMLRQQSALVLDLKSLSERRGELKLELEQIQSEIDQSRTNLVEIKVAVQSGQGQVTTLENRVAALTKEIESKQSEMRELDSSISKLKEEEGKLQESVAGLKNVQQETEQSLVGLESKLDRLNSIDKEIGDANKKLGDLNANIAKKEAQKGNANADLRGIIVELEVQKRELQDVKSLITLTRDSHQSELAQQKAEHDSRLKLERDQFQQEKAKHDARLELERAQLLQEKKEFQIAKAEHDEMIASFAADRLKFDAEKRQLQSDQKQCKDDYEQLQTALKNVEHNTEEVRRKLDSADAYVLSKRALIDQQSAATEQESRQTNAELAAQRRELYAFNEYLQSTYREMCLTIKAAQKKGMERVESIIATVRPTFPELVPQLQSIEMGEQLQLLNFTEYSASKTLLENETAQRQAALDDINASVRQIAYLDGAAGPSVMDTGDSSLAAEFNLPAEPPRSPFPSL